MVRKKGKEEKGIQACSKPVSNQILAQNQEGTHAQKAGLVAVIHYPNHRRVAEVFQSTYSIYLSYTALKSQEDMPYVISPHAICFQSGIKCNKLAEI